MGHQINHGYTCHLPMLYYVAGIIGTLFIGEEYYVNIILNINQLN